MVSTEESMGSGFKGKPTENTIVKQCNLPDLLTKHTTLYYTVQLKVLGHSMKYNFMESPRSFNCIV